MMSSGQVLASPWKLALQLNFALPRSISHKVHEMCHRKSRWCTWEDLSKTNLRGRQTWSAVLQSYHHSLVSMQVDAFQAHSYFCCVGPRKLLATMLPLQLAFRQLCRGAKSARFCAWRRQRHRMRPKSSAQACKSNLLTNFWTRLLASLNQRVFRPSSNHRSFSVALAQLTTALWLAYLDYCHEYLPYRQGALSMAKSCLSWYWHLVSLLQYHNVVTHLTCQSADAKCALAWGSSESASGEVVHFPSCRDPCVR